MYYFNFWRTFQKHFKTKNFFVWVNEEDHMRIISMEKGDNVRSIFQRFADATSQIQTVSFYNFGLLQLDLLLIVEINIKSKHCEHRVEMPIVEFKKSPCGEISKVGVTR